MTPYALNPGDWPSVQSVLTTFLLHLSRYDLPEPSSVQLDRCSNEISLQPAQDELPDLVVELLAWADSLEAAEIDLARLPSGAQHVHVTGRIGAGLRIKLYTSAAWCLLADHLEALDRVGRVVLSPAALRACVVKESGVIA